MRSCKYWPALLQVCNAARLRCCAVGLLLRSQRPVCAQASLNISAELPAQWLICDGTGRCTLTQQVGLKPLGLRYCPLVLADPLQELVQLTSSLK